MSITPIPAYKIITDEHSEVLGKAVQVNGRTVGRVQKYGTRWAYSSNHRGVRYSHPVFASRRVAADSLASLVQAIQFRQLLAILTQTPSVSVR